MQRQEDQRAHRRAHLEVAVNLESEDNFYAGIAGDVSEGGIFVATFNPPPVGATVELTLSLPDFPAGFPVRGVVRWIRDLSACRDGSPAGCGIQFTEIGADALAEVSRFVASRDTILFEAA